MSRPRLHDDGYLHFLRNRFCVTCGRGPQCEAAHIRIGFFAMGKKPDDRFAVSLCPSCHREQHSMNEAEFWSQRRLDPFKIAERLYAEFGGDGGKPKSRKKRVTIVPKGFGPKIKSMPFAKGKRKIQTRGFSGCFDKGQNK